MRSYAALMGKPHTGLAAPLAWQAAAPGAALAVATHGAVLEQLGAAPGPSLATATHAVGGALGQPGAAPGPAGLAGARGGQPGAEAAAAAAAAVAAPPPTPLPAAALPPAPWRTSGPQPAPHTPLRCLAGLPRLTKLGVFFADSPPVRVRAGMAVYARACACLCVRVLGRLATSVVVTHSDGRGSWARVATTSHSPSHLRAKRPPTAQPPTAGGADACAGPTARQRPGGCGSPTPHNCPPQLPACILTS
jgi:hypothetical protein